MRAIISIFLLSMIGCGALGVSPSGASRAEASRQDVVPGNSVWRIRGSVVDMETREPLIGANAIVNYRLPGSDSIRTAGAATNVHGRYVVQIPSSSPPLLVGITISYIGYETLESDMPQFPAAVARPGEANAGAIPSSGDGTTTTTLLIDRGQTNMKVVVTREDIRNLPVR